MSDTELAKRLEKLERDNRRLKGYMLGILVLAVTLGGISVAQPLPQKNTRSAFAHRFGPPEPLKGPQAVPDKIVAHEFDVLDNAGKVRVKIGIARGKAIVQLNDANGLGRLQLLSWAAGPQITLSKAQDTDDIDIFDSTLFGPSITVWSPKHTAYAAVEMVGKTYPAHVPNIELKDAKGFLMDLGSASTTNMITGNIQQTSADSITMFGNDKKHHVIWQAP